MKRYIYLLLAILVILPCFASSYNLHSPNDYKNIDIEQDEKTLFILDYSNSMNEQIYGERKFDMMVDTMRQILPQINPQKQIGLRIYGHRLGFTPMDGCRASSLVAPISSNNGANIEQTLIKSKPRGMTPITYSLKQAIHNDFIGFNGKKHIILLTDGGENCDESPCKYVMNLIKYRKDVNIDVIAFNISDEDDLEQLKCTALVTSGKFYNPQTSAELLNSFNNTIQRTKSVEAKIITH